jgi:protein-glutamine gamma-glutamyltransferase
MILVNNQPLDSAALLNEYPEGGIERSILKTLSESGEKYSYDSQDQLKFELRMRKEIVDAANALNASRLSFEIFRKTRCNQEYWRRREDGGFELRSGVRASDAVRDIFRNSGRYGTECATAMVIIYLKALLEIFPEDVYNRMFADVTLMNWNDIPSPLRGIGVMHHRSDYLPGDRQYFANPDVDPKTPEWQGENVIVMGDGTFYGHGIGKHHDQTIIRALNQNRREDADREAYLMDSAARPNFKRLFEQYQRAP